MDFWNTTCFLSGGFLYIYILGTLTQKQHLRKAFMAEIRLESSRNNEFQDMSSPFHIGFHGGKANIFFQSRSGETSSKKC